MRSRVQALAAAVLLAGCGREGILSPSETRAWQIARTTWSASPVRNAYRFETRQSCFCPRELTQWHTVDVRNGAVVAVTLEDGSPMPLPYRSGAYTVDKLFELLETERSPELRGIDVTFDGTHGYPTFLSFSYDPRLADAGLTVYARNLVPLP